MIETDAVAELIHRRRRQVLVHSIIYYRLGESILSDAVFDSRARELAALQREHPEASAAVEYMRAEFADFTGDTGFHLPLADTRAAAVAAELLQNFQEVAVPSELW